MSRAGYEARRRRTMNKAPRVCLFSRLVRSLLVYSTQDEIYLIYRRYVGCQYPGAAVERPPSASAHHAHCNAKKLSPYLYDWENAAGVWENPKECKEKRCMSESQQDEEKRKTRRRSADEPRSHPCYRPSHTTVGGGDNLGRTSTQSNCDRVEMTGDTERIP